MKKDVEFLLETINTHCTILRDQCHRVLKNHPAYMEPLNRIWSTLDLLTMASDAANLQIQTIDFRSADKDVHNNSP